MRWIVIDLVLACLALALLAVVAFDVWGRVKDLGRAVGSAGEVLGEATSALEQLQAGPGRPATRPTAAGHLAAPVPGVRSDRST